jgi:hypothetical protein
MVSTWAQNNAPHWVTGVQYQWPNALGHTATAQLASIAGGDRIAQVVAFV